MRVNESAWNLCGEGEHRRLDVRLRKCAKNVQWTRLFLENEVASDCHVWRMPRSTKVCELHEAGGEAMRKGRIAWRGEEDDAIIQAGCRQSKVSEAVCGRPAVDQANRASADGERVDRSREQSEMRLDSAPNVDREIGR